MKKGHLPELKGAGLGGLGTQTGDLFLDEIGTIPIEVQDKILRVVEKSLMQKVLHFLLIHRPNFPTLPP